MEFIQVLALFTVEETDTQEDQVACPGSQSQYSQCRVAYP